MDVFKFDNLSKARKRGPSDGFLEVLFKNAGVFWTWFILMVFCKPVRSERIISLIQFIVA